MAALLANSQNKFGHDVVVIFSRRPETPVNLRAYFDSGVRLVQVQMNSSFEKLESLVHIRAVIKNNNPDLIFLHSSFSGFLGRISSLFVQKASRFFYIPHCVSFMRKDISSFKKKLFILFEWVGALKKADYVACSRSEQEAIQAAIPFRRCHMVENALDFSSVPLSPHFELSNRKKVVITVGQIRTQKGPDMFAEIARSVRKIDPTVEFVWVGDGDPCSRRKLEESGVRIVGWVPKSDVWKYLGDACVYLSTARWEGMPVSVIEAGFAGLPVVASMCAGNVDVVEHGKTGWLFETPDEATAHVLTALRNSELSQSVAKTAFDIAKERFSVERYYREMEALAQS
ncbi:glycosyltransferase [Pseudomonas sp. LPB0260]|nr:glycosyltransferase [Pseudomonas sp. LPB0260]QLC74729.1 glycosyltransferase [Pseudomonas sp. LPB0260]